jgi:hypothetical protein
VEPPEQDQSLEPQDVDNPQRPRFSVYTQIIGIVGIVAMLAAGMLWVSGQRNAPSMASGSAAKVAEPARKSPATKASKQAEANVKAPSTSAEPIPQESDATKPPKAILDWIEYSPPGCDDKRSMGVNVIETGGKVDSVTLIWRAKEFDIENSRRIYRNGKQWTAYVQGVPPDTDVRLLAVVKGPAGEVTLGANISRYC